MIFSEYLQYDGLGLAELVAKKQVHPAELLQLAIERSQQVNPTLNAIIIPMHDYAKKRAQNVLSGPFAGVPFLVKDLFQEYAGYPTSYGCQAFKRTGHIAQHNAEIVNRWEKAGILTFGRTNTPEFGIKGITEPDAWGACCNPWNLKHNSGGSSGGSASAFAAGIVPIAGAGDGGGSIRIPAGFTGLVGLKATYGRIPRAPKVQLGNLTTVTGCVTRSVRDTARWFDVTSGHDSRDQLSLPNVGKWEPELGSFTQALRGLRVAVVPDWGGAVVSPAMWEVLSAEADQLIAEHGWKRVDIDTSLPSMGAAWSISGMLSIHAQLGDLWPACADVLTPEISFGLASTVERYGPEARARIEARRVALNERMAEIFHPSTGVDFVLTASNPDIAFEAEGPLPSSFGGVRAGAGNNGRLTFPANLHGNPAISIPAGFVDGLPVGLQVVSRHFTEQLLLDVALHVERKRPWPLVAS